MSRRLIAVAGAVALVVALGTFGVWQWRGGPGRERGGERGGEFGDGDAGAPGAVESIAETVPEEIRSTGRLVIGVNTPYPPNEFKDSQRVRSWDSTWT